MSEKILADRYRLVEQIGMGGMAIVYRAIDRNTGARGLRSIIEETMTDLMFTLPSRDDVEKVIITEDCVKNHAEPTLVLK